MKIINLATALKRLKRLNDEMSYAECFKRKTFSSGLIIFRPIKRPVRNQIRHADKDVVCQVIKGNGLLRHGSKRTTLKPGMICLIPKGTPHDFAAAKNGELVLFYSLIQT